MTKNEFRSNAAFVSEFNELLQSSAALRAAVIIMKDGMIIADADDRDPEIVSVRKLSRIEGRTECVQDFLELATPLPQPPVAIPETWAPEDTPDYSKNPPS
jgi:hypothetical protein